MEFFANYLPDSISQWALVHYFDIMLHLEVTMKRNGVTSVALNSNASFRESADQRAHFIANYITNQLSKCNK